MSVSYFTCSICGEVWSETAWGEFFCCKNNHIICAEHLTEEQENEFRNNEEDELPDSYCPVCTFDSLNIQDEVNFLQKIGVAPECKIVLKIIKETFDSYDDFNEYLHGGKCNKKSLNKLNSLMKEGMIIGKERYGIQRKL
jgi:hypothetical protein